MCSTTRSASRAVPDCPLCESKTGLFTCPRCGAEVAKQDAKILPERDFLVVVRHAGVYCPWCLKLIFSESQALVLGISKERVLSPSAGKFAHLDGC